MKLTFETAEQIEKGKVYKFVYPDGEEHVGVVFRRYADHLPSIGYATVGLKYYEANLNDSVEFTRLTNHPKVVRVGQIYDFKVNQDQLNREANHWDD